MSRKLTARDDAIRSRVSGWLSGICERRHLSDVAVAIQLLPTERRQRLERRGGARLVTQDAPRRQVKAWRQGEKTPSVESAFALGEALRRLGVEGMSGLQVAYRFGYAADVARALVTLSREPDTDVAALAFFVALPLLDEAKALHDLAALKPLKFGDVGKARDALLRQCSTLIEKSIARAGDQYCLSWRCRYKADGQLRHTFAYLDASVAGNIDAYSRLVWRTLLEWALLEAARTIALQLLPGTVELGLVSLSLSDLATATFSEAQRVLVDSLISRLELPQNDDDRRLGIEQARLVFGGRP